MTRTAACSCLSRFIACLFVPSVAVPANGAASLVADRRVIAKGRRTAIRARARRSIGSSVLRATGRRAKAPRKTIPVRWRATARRANSPASSKSRCRKTNRGPASATMHKSVADYIYDAFYSSAARARNQPARVELSRLTVNQYANVVADLVGSFRGGRRTTIRRG